jgi:hypothetical protein
LATWQIPLRRRGPVRQAVFLCSGTLIANVLIWRELLARAFLQEPVDPGSGRWIVEAEQVGLVRDLPVLTAVVVLAAWMLASALAAFLAYRRRAIRASS